MEKSTLYKKESCQIMSYIEGYFYAIFLEK